MPKQGRREIGDEKLKSEIRNIKLDDRFVEFDFRFDTFVNSDKRPSLFIAVQTAHRRRGIDAARRRAQ